MERQSASNQSNQPTSDGQQAATNSPTTKNLAEERMQRASEAAVIGFWELDVPGGGLWLSANFTNVLGLFDAPPPADTKALITSFLPRKDVLNLWSELEKTIRGEGDLHVNYCMTHPRTGEINWFESHGTLIRAYDGTPARVVGTAQNITERIQAELALRQSKERFRLMTDALPQLIWTTDAQGYTEFFNRQWVNYTGAPFQPGLIATMAAVFLHPDDRETTIAAFKGALEHGEPFSIEHRIRAATGEYRWFLVHAKPHYNPQTGDVIRWFGGSTDIHDRKMAEEAIRQSEERQAFLLRLTDQLSPLTDPAEIQYQAARGLGAYLGAARVGYAEDQDNRGTAAVVCNYTKGVPGIEGLHAYDDYSPELLLALKKGRMVIRNDVANDPTLTDKEKAAYASLKIGATINRPLMKAGQLVAAMFVHFQEAHVWSAAEQALLDDTAERTWAAIIRARAEVALRQSEIRLQKALSIETIGVFFFDFDGNVTDANDAFVYLSGHDRQTIERGALNLATLIKSEWMPATLHSLDELRQTGRFSPYEKQLVRPDGSQWWALSAGTRLSEHENVVFVLDITQRKQVEEALQESDRRKDEFLALLAHELRNPLATLSNTLLILQLTKGQNSALPLEAALSMMDREVKQLVHLVDDLLDVGRINQGKIQLRLQKLDLTRLITEAVEAARPVVEVGHRHLSLTVPDVPVYVQGDATRLTQLIRNLLSNATKFTNEGGRIGVRLEQTGQEASLQVVDNGIGIPAGQLFPIFDMFTQVDASRTRSQGGLGLGLTLVNQFVKLHGGRVEALSEGPGRGSTFIVHLPLSE